MRRTLAIASASIVVGSLLLAVLMPVWLPWAIRPALLAQGVRFGVYERHGFARFAVRDLQATRADATLVADRLELATPPVWLWRRLTRTAPAQPLLTLSGWHLTLPPPASAPTPPAAGSPAALLQQLEAILPTLAHWLPVATATNGSIQFGDHQLVVPEVDWRQTTLAIQAFWPPTAEAGHLRLAWLDKTAGQPLATATLTVPSRQVEAELALWRRHGQPQIDGFVLWLANRLELTAQFGTTGWWPERATATAPALHIVFPALTAAGYAALNGSLALDWRPAGYTLDLTAQAEPTQADHPLRPPVVATLRLAGDFQAARIEQASLATPGLEAKLAQPLPVDFRGQLGDNATIQITADLAQWPAWPATGTMAGTIRLQARPDGWPNLAFETTATTLAMPGGHQLEQAQAQGELTWPDKPMASPWPALTAEATASSLTVADNLRLEQVWTRASLAWPTTATLTHWPALDFVTTVATATVDGFQLEDLRATGNFNWPQLNIASLTVRQGEQATLTAHASIDWPAQRLASAELVADGLDLCHWLPADLAYDSLALTIQASGPLARPAHAGQLLVDGLRGDKLPATQLHATWHGEGSQLSSFSVQASSPPLHVELVGSLTLALAEQRLESQFDQLTIAWHNERLAQLVEPSQMTLAWNAAPTAWQIDLRNWRWQGMAGELTFDAACQWPRQGKLEVAIRQLDLDRWPQALPPLWPRLLVEHAKLVAAWENGPATFHATTAARWHIDDATELRLALRLNGDQHGLRLETAELADAESQLLTASGQLPITIDPARSPDFLHWHEQAPLAFQATIGDATQLWERLTTATSVRWQQPGATLSISGTLANPQARLQAWADTVEIHREGLTWPKIEAVRAEITVDATHATLRELAATVAGQPLRLAASLPLSPAFWHQPNHPATWPRLEQASGHLQVVKAQIADFATWLPSLLSPQGHLDIDLNLLPGLKLAGDLRLADAATRAMLPMGPVRNIQAHLRLADRRAEIVHCSGELTGQPVAVTGHLAWPVGGQPELSLHLLGQRVALARQPGLILRANVDLGLTAGSAAPPTLTGTIHLLDSFYLAEWRSLLPGQPLTSPRRPPFFSIDEEPFADWQLDIKVEGQRGLRVRTPLFRGDLSTNLRLGGTLGEPFAVGEVRVENGRLQFPFASIAIVDGYVVLASDNPYRPQLFVTGTARAFDYDLRLQVTGFADAPVWEMSATPPLTPEAIILLITAGEVPRDTITFSDTQRAGRLMFFFGRKLVSELWLDESAADRLVIRSGEAVTRDGRETYIIEYQLTDRWSLVGEYDQFNDINVGIKWRIYSK